MPRKIRKCYYSKCRHGGQINTETDEYVQDKNLYHADCYQEMKNLQLIRNLWIERISNTVSYSQLNKVLRSYLDRGISSDYLLFTLQYVIANHMALRYPGGLQYYIDREEIKKQYQKTFKSNQRQMSNDIAAKSNVPKFAVKTKREGFASIIGDQ